MQNNEARDSNPQSPGLPPKKKQIDPAERHDLYEEVKGKRENPSKPIVSRLFYMARLELKDAADDKVEQFQRQYEKDIREIVDLIREDYRREGADSVNNEITGFLRTSANCSLHFLESSSDVLNQFIDILYTHHFCQEKIGYRYDQFHILAFNEDNPYRCYADWGLHSSPHQSMDPPDIHQNETEEKLLKRAWEVYDKFAQAGIKSQDKLSTGSAGREVWKEISSEVKLSPEDFGVLQVDEFVNIEDFVRIYRNEMEIKLEDEMIFPQPPSLIDILEHSKILPDDR